MELATVGYVEPLAITEFEKLRLTTKQTCSRTSVHCIVIVLPLVVALLLSVFDVHLAKQYDERYPVCWVNCFSRTVFELYYSSLLGIRAYFV